MTPKALLLASSSGAAAIQNDRMRVKAIPAGMVVTREQRLVNDFRRKAARGELHLASNKTQIDREYFIDYLRAAVRARTGD